VSQNAMVAMPASFWAKPLAFELGNGLGLLWSIQILIA
jgi:hypothetical protein